MKIKFNVLALLLVLLSCLLCISCAKSNTTQDESNSQQNENTDSGTDTSPAFLNLVKDGKAVAIRYPLNADGELIQQANDFASSILRLTGVRPEVKDDWIREGTPRDTESTEILFGLTAYEESKMVYDNLGYGEAVVKVVGNKVVIAGFDSDCRKRAVTKVILEMSNAMDKKTKEITLRADWEDRSVVNELLSALPIAKVENAKIPVSVDCGDDCWQLLFPRAEKGEFESYLKALENEKYQLYASNEIDQNLFYTYMDDTRVVTAIYTPYSSDMRIMVEPLSMTALPALASENIYEKGKCSTLFSQLGLAYSYNGKPASEYFNGMSYVMRLEDGSFIIMDGGHAKEIDADRLYQVMQKQAPDSNHIVIAAWIFSHAHSDHVGVFPVFTTKYSDKVTVEQFIYNFPSEELAANGDDRRQMMNALGNENYKGVKRVKAHPGQKFYIRNAEIEILMGLDLLNPITGDFYYNDCSLTLTITAEGKKIMILGDTGSLGGHLLLNLYSANTLKCDILQVAHHGILASAGKTLYPVVAPTYAFWPAGGFTVDVGEHGIHYLDKESQNEYIMKEMDPANVFLAKDDIVVAKFMKGGIDITVYDTDTEYLAS